MWWWGQDEFALNVVIAWEEVFPEHDCFSNACLSLQALLPPNLQ